VSPWQMLGGPGELLLAVGTSGVESTTTYSVVVSEVQVRNMVPTVYTRVALTEYVPVAAVVADGIDGFCNPEVKLLGPSQRYADPAVLVAVNMRVFPEHIGPLLPNVGGYGVESTRANTVLELRQVIPSAVRDTVTV
jgi:hypothetical protein